MAQQYTYKIVMDGGSGQKQIPVASGYKFVSIINSTPDTVQLYEGQRIYQDADVRDALIELQPYSSMTIPLGDYRSYFTLVYLEGVVGDPPHVCNVIFSVDNLGITGPVGSPGNTNNVNITGDGAGLAKSNQLPQNLISGALATYIANTVAVTLASLPPLAAGTNNIGDVDVLTLPPITGTVGVSSLPPITGDVSVNTLPAVNVATIPAITGNVGVTALPAIPEGTNTIGKVDIAKLGMSYNVIVNSVAKRDTTAITSPAIQIDGYRTKRLFVNNTLDQAVNVRPQYSRDGSTWVSIGSAKTIASASGAAVITETDGAMLPFLLLCGYIRFVVDGIAAAPTTGSLTIDFHMATI